MEVSVLEKVSCKAQKGDAVKIYWNIVHPVIFLASKTHFQQEQTYKLNRKIEAYNCKQEIC